jgi:CheY-like chemotaxis protein
VDLTKKTPAPVERPIPEEAEDQEEISSCRQLCGLLWPALGQKKPHGFATGRGKTENRKSDTREKSPYQWAGWEGYLRQVKGWFMQKRILIAEDDFNSREALTKLAVKEGFEVIAVADGVELLSMANIGKFDVVITDLLMPDLNGASATEILKFQGDNTPIIAITGLSNHDIRHIKENFVRVFHKPIDTTSLFNYIRTLH